MISLYFRVLKYWLPIVVCLIIEEFVGYSIKFTYFLSKQTALSFIQGDLAQNHKTKLPSATTHTASFPPIVTKCCRSSSPLLIRLYTDNSSSSIWMDGWIMESLTDLNCALKRNVSKLSHYSEDKTGPPCYARSSILVISMSH